MALHNYVEKIGNDLYNQFSVGEYGNAWNNEKTGHGGTSRIIRTYGMPFLSIMGEIYGATTLTFQASQDGIHFYYCAIISATIVPVQPPAPTWEAGISYAAGDEVTLGGDRYVCILSHVSNVPRQPPNATYWELVPGSYPQQFHIYPTVGAEYVRLRSSANVRATVTVAAKRAA